MNLSNEQRLIVAMLASIQQKLAVTEDDDAVNPAFIMEAIRQNQQWAIPNKYIGLFALEPSPPQVTRVYAYLGMWEHLESAYDELSAKDKKRVAAALGLGKSPLRMPGFDAKTEWEFLATARFILQHMCMFARFLGRGPLIASRPMLETYEATYEMYRLEMLEVTSHHLSADQLLHIFKVAD
ncbi:YfbU family protein [Lysobacter sp. Hz 25]|uniref:YfbU family protein n=1 Tax=Lysobacter sp. Hz 25 TaxID=3383698 RepID=UPI0038D5001C